MSADCSPGAAKDQKAVIKVIPVLLKLSLVLQVENTIRIKLSVACFQRHKVQVNPALRIETKSRY